VTDAGTRDRFLVDQIFDHAEVIAVNVLRGRDAFETDPTVRYAVEHATELVGEAAEKLSRPFKSENPLIPWDRLRELRRIVAHPYDPGALPAHVDQTWRFAREEVPRLVRRLRAARFPHRPPADPP
jgi:uncharacterized protein with HEPN domain